MLKITVSTKTISNVTVSTNSVVEYDPYFFTERIKVVTIQNEGEENEATTVSYKEQTSIIYKNKTWAKAADYQDGTTPEIDKGMKEYGVNYKYSLSDAQMDALKAQTGEFTNVFNGVENIIIKAIEDGWSSFPGVGTGNVIHYDATF